MRFLRVSTIITLIATACHLDYAHWIISNDIVTVPMTSQGQRSQRKTRSVKVQLSSDQIKELVTVHNYLRAREGASDMEFMSWNHQLAEMGQLWAEQCIWQHGQPQYTNPPYKQIGQNLWAHEAGANMTAAIFAFWEEKQYYNYNTLQCQANQVCGHYTQVVWSDSKEVGCGLFKCASVSYLQNAAYLVCNYGPPGNFRGQKPFKKGKSCTQCESGSGWCIEGLCTDNCRGKRSCECAAVCKNCATFDAEKCSCDCSEGWTGPGCSEPCKDLAPQCGANPGWPFSWCQGHEYSNHVRQNCPRFCNICKGSSSLGGKCEDVGPGTSYQGGLANSTRTVIPQTLVMFFAILVNIVNKIVVS